MDNDEVITSIVNLPIKTTHEKSADGLHWVMREKYAVPYLASLKAQLNSWVAGKPVHCHFSDECCPDFSCCNPGLLWPEHKRRLFAESSNSVRLELMMGGLQTLADSVMTSPKKVDIASIASDNSTIH